MNDDETVREGSTTPPPEDENQTTTPPGNPEIDEDALEKGREKLEQAGH